MTPDQLVLVILAILGALLQLALMYAPKFSDWYQNSPNKGLLALAFSAVIGGIYFALSCSPFAADFNIALSCTKDGVFTLVQAIYVIAITQQAAFLILPKNTKG